MDKIKNIISPVGAGCWGLLVGVVVGGYRWGGAGLDRLLVGGVGYRGTRPYTFHVLMFVLVRCWWLLVGWGRFLSVAGGVGRV